MSRIIILIFKRIDGCLGTFYLSSYPKIEGPNPTKDTIKRHLDLKSSAVPDHHQSVNNKLAYCCSVGKKNSSLSGFKLIAIMPFNGKKKMTQNVV